jgi:hypothetical protein
MAVNFCMAAAFGGRVALRRAWSLADVDGEEGHVVPARLHLVEVDLGVHRLRVSLGRGVIARDVLVRVDREHALVDGAGARDECGVVGRGGLGGDGATAARSGEGEGGEGKAAHHELGGRCHPEERKRRRIYCEGLSG